MSTARLTTPLEESGRALRGGGPQGRGGAAGGGTTPKLEREDYKWTHKRRIEFKDTRCSCRTCEQCGRRVGWRVRNRLLAQADRFKRPAMLTLTVDRDRFASPQDAHSHITENGYIRRLMNRLGLSLWVWVLEFQGKTGDGWPHWHVLLDMSSLPKARIDLKRVWYLWRDRWLLGGAHLQTTKPFQSSAHAVSYVTKYLTKPPSFGFPLWVLRSEKRIRFFQGSRKLGALVAEPRKAKPAAEEQLGIPDTEEDPLPKHRASMRPLLDRMAECGMSCNAVLVTPEPDGTASYRHLGTIPVTASRLVFLSTFGEIRLPISVEKVKDFYENGSVMRRVPLVIDDGDLDVNGFRQQVDDELGRCGHYGLRQQQIENQTSRLLKKNRFADRIAQLNEEARLATPEEGDDEEATKTGE